MPKRISKNDLLKSTEPTPRQKELFAKIDFYLQQYFDQEQEVLNFEMSAKKFLRDEGRFVAFQAFELEDVLNDFDEQNFKRIDRMSDKAFQIENAGCLPGELIQSKQDFNERCRLRFSETRNVKSFLKALKREMER